MKKTILLLLISFLYSNVFCQNSEPSVISTAGEVFQGNSMSIEWTLGETAVTTINNSSNQITQGFHQPYYVITSIGNIPSFVTQIDVFPNPTSDWLQINLLLDKNRKIEFQLYDLIGKMVWQSKNQGVEITEKKSLKDLPSSTYFLKLIIDNQPSNQVFKIQKLN